MNCIKITPPLPIFVNFYYYYSYFTLFITVGITPLMFYVIFTQSKNLGSFKWLILNHSIWCLFFEILFTFVKPIVLPPSLSGYYLGWLKNGSPKETGIALYAFCMISSLCVCSLGATLLCRYFLVFPATKWFNKKRGIVFFAICSLIFLITFFFPLFFFLTMDISEMYRNAANYEPCLIGYFTEPSFIFLSRQTTTAFLLAVLSLAILLMIMLIFVAVYFVYLVKTNINATKTSLSNSLMISAIVQLSISIFFIMVPLTVFVVIEAFEIPETENIVVLNFCLLLNHSFLEFFATLYYVRPYRKYVAKFLKQVIPCICFIKNPRQISVISNIAVVQQQPENT